MKIWWFKPYKVCLQSKELLQSIPKQQRQQGTKDQDLLGELPTDKGLGICCNIADDNFSFKIKLNRISLTKKDSVVNDKLHL